MAELPLSVVFHLWLEEAAESEAVLSEQLSSSFLAGFKEETAVEPAWIFAEDVEAALLAWRRGGGIQSVAVEAASNF